MQVHLPLATQFKTGNVCPLCKLKTHEPLGAHMPKDGNGIMHMRGIHARMDGITAASTETTDSPGKQHCKCNL